MYAPHLVIEACFVMNIFGIFPRQLPAKLLALSLSLFGLPLWSQTTTALKGRTVTNNDEPMAQVELTLETVAGGAEFRLQSSRSGSFRFANLSPGLYRLTARKAGFEAVVQEVGVHLGEESSVTVILMPEVREKLEVRAESITEQIPGAGVVLKFSELERAPTDRDLASVALLAPGVSNGGADGRLTISGARGHESMYLIDGGVATFDNRRGQPSQFLIEDAILEAQVQTAGIAAHQGFFSGGIVNAVSKSGDNTFTGSLRAIISNRDWREETPFEENTQDSGEEPGFSNTYMATVGGPIVKDKAWFFIAGRNLRDDYSAAFILPVTAPAGTAVPVIPAKTEDDRFSAKLTWAPAPNHTFIATYHDAQRVDKNLTGNGVLSASAVLPESRTDESLLSLEYRWIVNSALSFDFLVTDKNASIQDWYPENLPQGDIRAQFAEIIDRNTIANAGGPTTRGPDPEHRDNTFINLKGRWFLDQGRGIHDITFGFQQFRDRVFDNNNGGVVPWEVVTPVGADEAGNPILSFGSGTLVAFSVIEERSKTSDLNTQALFISDDWQMNDRLLLRLGLRYEDSDADAQNGEPAIDDRHLDPRFYTAYQLDERQQLSFGFARYTARISGVIDRTVGAGRTSDFVWLYGGPATNNVADVFQWFDTNLGDPLSNEALARAVQIIRFNPDDPQFFLDPDLKSPFADEILLGYEFAGQGGFRFSADLISKEWSEFLALRNSPDLGTTNDGVDISELTNDDENYAREYHAVQVQAEYRINDRWRIGGHYTWSQLYGNAVGESVNNGSEPLRELTQYPEYNQFEARLPMGYLPGDRRHAALLRLEIADQFKKWQWQATLYQKYGSGTPYYASGRVPASPAYGFPSNPGYGQPPRSVVLLWEPPNTYRTEAYSATDLALFLSRPIGKGVVFDFRLDILNLFNEEAFQRGSDNINSGVLTNVANPFDVFNEQPTAGVNYTIPATFGTARTNEAYQNARQVKLNVVLRF